MFFMHDDCDYIMLYNDTQLILATVQYTLLVTNNKPSRRTILRNFNNGPDRKYKIGKELL